MLDQPTLPADVPEYFDADNPEDSYEVSVSLSYIFYQ